MGHAAPMARRKSQRATSIEWYRSPKTNSPATESAVASKKVPSRRIPTAIFPLAAIAALVTASIAMLNLIRHQGVGIGGDEPSYLVEAVAIGRFHTLNLNPGFNFALIHHSIFPWHAHPGPHLAAVIGHASKTRHGLYLPGHAIGLSALLAIPMLAGTGVAVVTLIVVLAALAVGLVHLIGEVSDIRSPWHFMLLGLFLAPAYVLATTQVYPDLISGMIMAIILMLIAVIERRGSCTTLQLIAGIPLLALLPWLDQKNILLTPPLLVALCVVYFRTKLPTSQFGWLMIPAVMSLVCLVALNLWGYGYPLGSGQPISVLGGETVTRAIALLFDRRQGIFVQMPTVLLGLAGVWALRRRIPVAAGSAVVIVLATVYGNATQKISFGGGGFIGRFGWPVLPVLLAFAGLYLLELWKVRNCAAWSLAAIIAVLYVIQVVPFALDEHVYFNQIAWDPARYAGWWGSLDPSPILGYIGGVQVGDVIGVATDSANGIVGVISSVNPWENGRVLWGLATMLLVAAAAVYYLLQLVKSPSRIRLPVVCAVLSAGVVTFSLTLLSPVLLPATVAFNPSTLLSQVGTKGETRVAVGAADHGAVILGPYWSLLPGRYEATIGYHLKDPRPNVALVRTTAIARPPTAGLAMLSQKWLSETQDRSSLTFSVPKTEQVVISVQWNGTGTLQVTAVKLAKLGST